MRFANCYAIIQDNIYLVDFAQQNTTYYNIIPSFTKLYSIDIIKNQKNFKYFGNVNNQLSFIKDNNFDFCIGTRIHGCISALLCNIPVLNLSIDSRTYELCDIMSVPFVNCIENNVNIYNNKDPSIDNLIEFIKSNYKLNKKKLSEHIDYQNKIYDSFFN